MKEIEGSDIGGQSAAADVAVSEGLNLSVSRPPPHAETLSAAMGGTTKLEALLNRPVEEERQLTNGSGGDPPRTEGV